MLSYALANDLFSRVNGSTFVGIDTRTVPVLKGGKKNPMQGRVTKIMKGASVMVFQNRTSSSYGDMVQRRLAAEGKDPASFELKPRSWGTRLPNSPFVHHVKDGQDKYYLEVIFLRAGDVEYFLDDKPINKEDIQGLQEKDESEQGGLENKVIIRSYSLESITGVRLDKNHHYFG